MIQNESKPSVQREAVIAYLQIGGSEAIDCVNKTIKKQGNQFLKYYIVLGLERIEPDKALSKLADIYKTNYDLGMRLQIAKSIYNLNTEKRISVLEDLAKLKRKDDKESLESYRKGRINILNMFTKFEGSKVLSLLKTIIKDKNEDPWIRQHCVRLLPAVREKLGLPYIYDLIDDNSLEPADTAGKAINGIAVQLAGDFRSREVGADEALIKKTIKKLKKLFLKSGQSLLSFSYRHSLIKLGISAEVLDAAKKKLENRNSTSERIRQQENARARAHSTTAARPEASNTRGRATQSRVPERYDTNGR
jgi:hypothetical protein